MLRNRLKQFIQSKSFPKVSYSLFFTAVFLICFYAAFPSDALKKRIISEIEAKTPYRAEIASLGVYPPFTLQIRELKLQKTPESSITIDRLRVSPSLLRLIFSDEMKLPFSAELFGGRAKGVVAYNLKTGQVAKASSDFASVAVDKVIFFISSGSESEGGGDTPRITGLLSGDFSITLGANPAGKFAFTASGFGVSNLKVGGFPLPEFKDLKSSFSGELANNLTKIEKLDFLGEDIELMLAGAAPLPWNIKRGAVLDLGLRLQVKGKKLAVVKTILATYLTPQGDGSLEGKIAGTVGAPKVLKETTPDI